MTEQEIQEVALRFFQGKTTPEEEQRLHQWFDDYKNRPEETLIVKTNNENRTDVHAKLFAAIQTRIKKEERGTLRHIVARKTIMRWTAVASILLFISIWGIYYYMPNNELEPVRYTQLLDGDVGPGGNNAILELADGRTINLDVLSQGVASSLGNMQVKKEADGLLTLDVPAHSVSPTVAYNTIRTPAGGQYQIQLPDGTKVWLNASSSLTFPSVFDENHRQVEVRGEAYFEVARVLDVTDSPIPFFVLNSGQRIEVLGTSFNVSDYTNEPIRTVLLKGSVRVHSLNSDTWATLVPGEQAQLVGNEISVTQADFESAIAWKNGDFMFNQETLPNIMKKLERWYDIDVEYHGMTPTKRFSGMISRSRNLSDVLEIMESTETVSFKIEGRRVSVMM